MLAKAGADLEATYMPQEFTALIMAATMKRLDAEDALLQSGTKVDHAAVGAEDPKVIDRLVAAGADVNRRIENGPSVLDLARKTNDPALIEALTATGAR